MLISEPKLALVIDKSEAYIGFQRERILKKWGAENHNTRKINNFSEISGANLFEETPVSCIHIEDPEACKALIKEFESLSQDRIETISESGVLVTSTLGKVPTRKLKQLFLDNSAIIFSPPDNREETLSEKLLGELSLARDVREFLISYAGDNYEILVPIVDNFSTLPPAAQKKITENDVYLRISQKMGALPPWEIEKYILSNNVEKAIDILRRTQQHSSFLVVLSVLKKKFQTWYRIAVLVAENPKIKNDEIAEILKIPNNGSISFSRSKVTSFGVDKIEELVKIMSDTEAKVKGSAATDPMVVMEISVVNLCKTIHER